MTFRPADEACTNVGGDKLAAACPEGLNFHFVVSQKNVVFCLLIDSDKVVNKIIPHLLIEFFAPT